MQSRRFVQTLRAHPGFDAVEPALDGRVDLAAIERGFDVGWLELRIHNAMTTIVEAVLGADALLQLWRDTFTQSMEQRFLASFVELLTPLAGGSLVPIARRAPRVYEYLARACGTMQWTDSDTGGVLRLRGFPTEFTFNPWLMCNLGSLQAAAASLGGRTEQVELVDVDASEGNAAFRVKEH